MNRRSIAVAFAFTTLLLLPAPDSARAASGEAQFLTEVRQLIFEGKRSGEGYFSPDGQSLIFQSEREPDNPFYQIYLLDFQTGASRFLQPPPSVLPSR